MRYGTRGPAGALAFALAVQALPSRAENMPVAAAAAYCEDLLLIIDIAVTKNKFVVIASKAREGDFLDTTLPLAGWKDCSLYGARTYTCDSQRFGTATAAEKALASFVQTITACLGEGWAADSSRSSPDYVLVQHPQSPVAMTLSTDVPEPNEHTVRLIVFVRGRPDESR